MPVTVKELKANGFRSSDLLDTRPARMLNPRPSVALS